MDEDLLMAMLGNITQELSDIKSEIANIQLWMPNEADTSDIERKLDKIIDLLDK